MAKKTLSIIDNAYRGTIEEQDDAAIWFTGAIKGAGGDLALLLQGSAVNYASKAQDSTELEIGGEKLHHPPDFAKDLGKLIEKGVPVHLVKEDAKVRGVTDVIEGVQEISRKELPALLGRFDQIWHW